MQLHSSQEPQNKASVPDNIDDNSAGDEQSGDGDVGDKQW